MGGPWNVFSRAALFFVELASFPTRRSVLVSKHNTSTGQIVLYKLNEIWKLFEAELFTAESTATLFNHYRDEDRQYDRKGAAEIRRENLWNYLDSFRRVPKILIIGIAPGYQGCRFSGVPFTSERQLCNGALPFSGKHRYLCSGIFLLSDSLITPNSTIRLPSVKISL